MFKRKYVVLTALSGLAILSAATAWVVVAPWPSVPANGLTARSTPASPVPTADPTLSEAPMITVRHPRTGPADFQAGVAVVVYGNYPGFQTDTQTALDHLASIGVNSISFVFPIFEDTPYATSIHEGPMTPTYDKIAFFIRQARRRGFTVMLRPLLDDVSLQAQSTWRGSIAPSNSAAWFGSYTGLLVQYARIAQAEGAQMIDIGTEFKSLETATNYWLELIHAVRQVYSGQLTYSANWDDNRYPRFGSALDFIGVDAFYTLQVAGSVGPDQIAAAWHPWLMRAKALRHAFGKPVLFTELGTTSEVGSFQVPWLWKHGTGVSQEAQRVYYAGSCKAVKDEVGGMYWWQFNIAPLSAPQTDIGYNPQGKLAEAEIAKCFG